MVLWILIGLVVLGCLVAFVLMRRSDEQTRVKSNTQQMATPTVLVVKPRMGDKEVHLTLPAPFPRSWKASFTRRSAATSRTGNSTSVPR